MTLRFSKLALQELEDARIYYNLQQESLGERFKQHVQESVDNIVQSPVLYPKVTDALHRVVMHKFPYSIFYALLDDTLIIVSIAHQNRKPFYTV